MKYLLFHFIVESCLPFLPMQQSKIHTTKNPPDIVIPCFIRRIGILYYRYVLNFFPFKD